MSQIYKPSTGGGGGSGIQTISGDTGSISGSSVTIYAHNSTQNSGSTVAFVNSGTISTLNVTDSNHNSFISNGAGSATNTGTYNTGLGADAGNSYTGTESSNIVINNHGKALESHVLRIGAGTGTGTQEINSAFISGITGISPSIFTTPQVVLCDNTDQLSTISSSTAGFVLTSNGASGGPPTFQTVPAGTITINGDSSFAAGSTISLVAFDGANVCGGSIDFVGNGVSKMSLQVTDVNNNTFLGNIAGNSPLFVTGNSNSAFGAGSLATLSSGTGNTSIGVGSMGNFLNGASCVAIGNSALGTSLHDSFNTCVGVNSLLALDGGSNNTAIGYNAATGPITGSYNCFFGVDAGSGYSSTESHNVIINNNGTFTDNHTLRIGAGTGSGTQQLTHAYISGITGSTPTSGNSPQVVLCDNADNLTVISSSTAGFVLTSNGAATPSFQAVSTQLTWTNEGISFSALANNGYICGGVTATLPASPSLGDTISFISDTVGTLIIQATGTQHIRLGSLTSSAAGTATNTSQGDTMTLVYSTSSGNWISNASTGNWSLA